MYPLLSPGKPRLQSWDLKVICASAAIRPKQSRIAAYIWSHKGPSLFKVDAGNFTGKAERAVTVEIIMYQRHWAGTGRPVQWVTPLGLPVVQPYRKAGEVAVKTVVQVRSCRDKPENVGGVQD